VTEPAQLLPLVQWSAFALAFVFGFVANKTNFCTMGAVSDIHNMGDWSRMRMWLLAIAIAILGSTLLEAFHVVDLRNTIYTGPRFVWLSNLLGGLLFGFGMTLGSGCGSKTLVRLGAGNLKSLIVLIFMAIAAYMTLRGLFAALRSEWIDPVAFTLPTNQDLPSLIAQASGVPRDTLLPFVGMAVAIALLAFVFRDRSGRGGDVLLGGIVVGLVVVGGWIVTGVLGYVPEDPETLQQAWIATNSGRMESLSFVAPQAYWLEWLMLWTDKSRLLSFGMAAAAGVVAGAFAHAMLTRGFRLESFRDAEDLMHHIVAGILMGFGGVLALGCTIGQGVSGFSTLALGSLLSFAAIVAGSVLSLRYQYWRMERIDRAHR